MIPHSNLKQILKAFSVPFFLFVVHVIADYAFGLYENFPWIDIPMHFLGGVSIAITVHLLYSLGWKTGYLTPFKPLLRGFLTVTIVTWVAVWWELAEFLGDAFLGTHMQLGIHDTMGDLFLGMLGGFFGAVCMKLFWLRK